MSHRNADSNGSIRDPDRAARPVAAGDTLVNLTADAAARDAVERGVERSQTRRSLTLRDVLASHAKGEPDGEVIANIRALL